MTFQNMIENILLIWNNTFSKLHENILAQITNKKEILQNTFNFYLFQIDQPNILQLKIPEIKILLCQKR